MTEFPVILRVKVTPKARFQRIKKEITEDGSVLYKVYVTAVAEDGKANKAVIALLAEFFYVAKSSLHIIRGHHSHEKLIKIDP